MRFFNPSPKNSTNLPTTPLSLNILTTVKTRSVAVVPSGILFFTSKPITSGINIDIGWPSIPASASIPPTPHPSTDNPFTIVVWLSVPTSVSGKIYCSSFTFSDQTTFDKYSKFTWWQIPVPGGTILKLLNAFCPHFKNEYLSPFLLNSISTFLSKLSALADWSTCTEWSITKSTADKGFIVLGSFDFSLTASRIAARSATAGIPV